MSATIGQARLVSTSNHRVSTDGTSWFKEPGPLAYAPAALVHEARVLTLLGRRHTFDGTVLVTPHLGEPVTDLARDVLAEMVQVLLDPPRLPGSHGLEPMSDQPERVAARLEDRLADRRPDVTDIALALLRSAGPGPSGDHLVHTDPHLGNWVRGADGLVLLDWESALAGPAGADLAGLWHSTVVDRGRTDLGDVVLAAVPDRDVFAWAVRVKAAAGLSWVTWKRGPDAGADRIEVLDRELARIGLGGIPAQ